MSNNVTNKHCMTNATCRTHEAWQLEHLIHDHKAIGSVPGPEVCCTLAQVTSFPVAPVYSAVIRKGCIIT